MIRVLDMIRAAAEPQEQSNGWRWVSFDVPFDTETQKLMRRIRTAAAHKRVAPTYRHLVKIGRGPTHPSYMLLFRDNTEFRRYALGLYALAKKLGATPEMLGAMRPDVLSRQYSSTMRVQLGSEVWKFLVKYGFQTDSVQAAVEPRATQDLSRAFNVLLAKFKTPRTTTVQGHVVKITCGDDELDDILFLRTTSADGEEHEVWACDVEINGKIAIEVAVPDRERSGPAPGGAHLQYIHHATSPEDLLQQLVRYLVHSYKAVHAATAAVEPNRLNVEALEHVFKQIKGTVYTTEPSRDFPRTRFHQAVIRDVMSEDRKPIWIRPTLLLVTQLQVHDTVTDLISLRGTTPNHAYFDPETNELVVLGQVGAVNPKEIGRKHVTDARAAVKYILQCLIKHDDPLRSWR